VCLVHITCPPETIDVNISPDKMTIGLQHEALLLAALEAQIRAVHPVEPRQADRAHATQAAAVCEHPPAAADESVLEVGGPVAHLPLIERLASIASAAASAAAAPAPPAPGIEETMHKATERQFSPHLHPQPSHNSPQAQTGTHAEHVTPMEVDSSVVDAALLPSHARLSSIARASSHATELSPARVPHVPRAAAPVTLMDSEPPGPACADDADSATTQSPSLRSRPRSAPGSSGTASVDKAQPASRLSLSLQRAASAGALREANRSPSVHPAASITVAPAGQTYQDQEHPRAAPEGLAMESVHPRAAPEGLATESVREQALPLPLPIPALSPEHAAAVPDHGAAPILGISAPAVAHTHAPPLRPTAALAAALMASASSPLPQNTLTLAAQRAPSASAPAAAHSTPAHAGASPAATKASVVSQHPQTTAPQSTSAPVSSGLQPAQQAALAAAAKATSAPKASAAPAPAPAQAGSLVLRDHSDRAVPAPKRVKTDKPAAVTVAVPAVTGAPSATKPKARVSTTTKAGPTTAAATAPVSVYRAQPAAAAALDEPRGPMDAFREARQRSVTVDLNDVIAQQAHMGCHPDAVRPDAIELSILSPIGALQPHGGWLLRDAARLVSLNYYRAQECVMFHTMLSTHRLPAFPVEPPVSLHADMVKPPL
jgi:hypothetical protein